MHYIIDNNNIKSVKNIIIFCVNDKFYSSQIFERKILWCSR